MDFAKMTGNISDFLYTYILIAILISLGLYFTVKSKFVQFRYFKEMFRLLGDGATQGKEEGHISSFQAFCISTASRVGTGNLAGIAIAISLGGPGAVFWMWLIALIGAGSSFVESTLAQIYKEKDKSGAYKGGPAYYIEKGLNKKWLGVTFSVLITLSFGLIFNSVQSNTIALAVSQVLEIKTIYIGIVLAIVTGIVIVGGVQRVANVSSIIVPVMAAAYIGVALYVMVINITEIPSVILLIFKNAFGINQAIGGGLGGVMLVGIKRGLFSNEAGMGSAPNAAATATVSHPVKQGLIQTLAVFNDTILICSCTAFIILLSDIDLTNNKLTGIQLTQKALSSQIGSLGSSFIAFCILLFAFSSIVGNYYYGESNIEFLIDKDLDSSDGKLKKILSFGGYKFGKKFCLNAYRVMVVCMVLFGAVAELQTVWNLADIFMALMAIINLVAITLLCKVAFKALEDYTKQKKAGINDPVFKSESIPELENVTEW